MGENTLVLLINAAMFCAPVTSFFAVEGTEAAITAGSQDQRTSPIPFRNPKNEVLIDVYIKKQGPFTFLIDTGVKGAAIKTDLARQLGIPLDERNSQMLGVGPSKGARIYQTSIPDLTVGELKFESLQAAALPLSIFGDKLGEPVHGILGDGFLRQQATRIDFENQTLTFADSFDEFKADVDAADYVAALRIAPDGDMPLVEVNLGGKTFTASIDIGSSLGLEIFMPYAEEFGLGDVKDTWQQVKVTGGSFGEAISYEGTIPAIDIGPMHFKNVTCSLTPARSDKNRKGNLGNQLWDGYVVIIDYGNEKLVFRKVDR